ncbi:PAS domain-containing protein, partial [Chloroflexota bacterium]
VIENERNKAEELLKESEEIYRNLVETSPTAIVTGDIHGNLTFVNEYLAKMHGYVSSQDLLNETKNIRELVGPESQMLLEIQLTNVLESGYSKVNEYILPKKGGGSFPAMVSATAMKDSKGKPTGFLAVAVDITERKRAEEQIHLEKSFFELLVGGLPGVFYVFNREGKFLRWNDNFAKVTEYSNEEISNMNPPDFFEGKDKQLIAERIGNVFSEGQSDAEAFLVSKNGNRIPHYFTGSRIELYGEPCLIGMGIDITARKQTEEELLKSEERLRILSDAPFEAIVIHDKGNLLLSNDQFYEMFGRESGESFDIAEALTPESLQTVVERFTSGYLGPYEATGVRKDGTQFPIEIRVRTMEYGNTLARIAAIRDITEHKRAGEALKESEAKYSAVAGKANDGIAIVYNERITFSNEALARIMGCSVSELEGRALTDLMTSESAEYTIGLYRKRMSGESVPSVYQVTALCKGGTTKDVEISAGTIPYADDVASMAFIRDISEQKRAEEALQNERDRAQQYLDVAGVMFVAVNKQGEVELVNRKGCDILGYDAAEIIGKNWFQNFLPESIRDQVHNVFIQLMSGDIEPVEYFENPILTKTGKEKFIAWHNTILKDDTGLIIGTLSSGEDITERKQVEEVAHQQRQLAESLNSVSEIDEGLHLCLDAGLNISGMDSGGAYLVEESTGALNLIVHHGLSPEFVELIRHFGPDSTQTQLVMKGVPIYNAYHQTKLDTDEVRQREGIKIIGIIPILYKDRVVGCLNIASHALEEFPGPSH